MLNNLVSIFQITAQAKPSTVDYLVIAGGGAGSGQAGAGGAGGYRTSTSFSLPASFTVTIGGGGTGNNLGTAGTVGTGSVFSSISASGGGYGAPYGAVAAAPTLAQYKSAACIKTGTDAWYVVGAIA